MKNRKITSFCRFLLILTVFWLMTPACRGNEHRTGENRPVQEPRKALPSHLANPAAEQCIKDGFKLQPIIKNGVTKGFLCVNPDTGKKCEIWKYYRGECRIR